MFVFGALTRSGVMRSVWSGVSVYKISWMCQSVGATSLTSVGPRKVCHWLLYTWGVVWVVAVTIRLFLARLYQSAHANAACGLDHAPVWMPGGGPYVDLARADARLISWSGGNLLVSVP